MGRVLITGANRGIGLAIAEHYLQHPDVQIFAACRRPESADALQAQAQRVPDRVQILRLDVNNAIDIQSAVKTIQEAACALDVLINNAGIYPPGGPTRTLGELDADAIAEVLITNAVAPLMITQAFIDLLKAGDNPRVVMVSSQMGSLERARGGGYAYRMSKAAMNMAARVLAADHPMEGITTVTLHPGWVQTDMGGQSAAITPDESGRGIVDLVTRLTPADNGRFYNWKGEAMPW